MPHAVVDFRVVSNGSFGSYAHARLLADYKNAKGG